MISKIENINETKLLIMSDSISLEIILLGDEIEMVKDYIINTNISNTKKLGIISFSGSFNYLKILRTDPIVLKNGINNLLINLT